MRSGPTFYLDADPDRQALDVDLQTDSDPIGWRSRTLQEITKRVDGGVESLSCIPQMMSSSSRSS